MEELNKSRVAVVHRVRGQGEANGAREKQGLDYTVSDRHDKSNGRT